MLLATALWSQGLAGSGAAQFLLSDSVVLIGHWSAHGTMLRSAGPLSTFQKWLPRALQQIGCCGLNGLC